MTSKKLTSWRPEGWEEIITECTDKYFTIEDDKPQMTLRDYSEIVADAMLEALRGNPSAIINGQKVDDYTKKDRYFITIEFNESDFYGKKGKVVFIPDEE